MTIQLDHALVPSRTQAASAKLLAELLGVSWAETVDGGFSAVYVNDGMTLDFQDTDEKFPIYHFCFRVSPAEFDAILSRIKKAGIKFRDEVHAPDNMTVGTYGGGKNVYWNLPDGHYWEMLTVSYARPAK